MTEQTLFKYADLARAQVPLARDKDPQTSKDAAKKMIESGALNRQEDEVLFVIDTLYTGVDFTPKDIAARMLSHPYHKAYDICRRRFSGLANKGKIELVYEIIPHPKILNMKLQQNKRRDGCRVWRLK